MRRKLSQIQNIALNQILQDSVQSNIRFCQQINYETSNKKYYGLPFAIDLWQLTL